MGNQQGGVKTTFSPLHGSNIELLREGVVATRKDKKSPSNAVLYTEHPVPLGCKFEVKLEEKVKYFNSNLKIGFTIFKPESSLDIAKSFDKLKTRFDHWILSGSSAWNGNVHWAVKYDLESLSQGDIIGCRVREGGRLCFYVNGEYKRYKGQVLTNLPDSEPLYGFVDLYGDAIRVRALPIVDRSGGKGTGYSSGSLKRQHRTLPPRKNTLDPNVPTDTKKKSGTMFIISHTTSTSSMITDDSINRSMTLAVDTNVQLFSMPSKRWNNRAFGCFHEKASPNIIFKENRGIAIRQQPGKTNGFVFTQEPLRLEETFTVRLMELSGNYHVSLGIGITTLDPSSIEIPQSSLYLSHNPDYWVAITDTLRHTGNVYKIPFNLDALKCKTKIGIMVKFNGDLHMFLNDKDEGKICSGVPTNKPLYGFVDLAGQAVKIRSMFYSAKSATTPFKEHGTEVEEVCQQIANEVVALITIYLQTENAVDATVTHIERRNSLVETTLGRNWHTGSFTGSFSSNSNKQSSGGSSKFTINFMEKLQHKVRSKHQSSSTDKEELQQSLQKSLTGTNSDSTATEQKFTEEDEETMRQLLNPDTGDADDLASQIVDRIPDDILNLLSMKFVPSSPETKEDPIETAHSIILEVLINTMSTELSGENEPSTSGKYTLKKQFSKSPALKKRANVTGSVDKPDISSNDGTSSLQKQLSSSKSPALAKNISITSQSLSVDKPEAGTHDATTTEGCTPVINAQLLFSQITTTIACAVIEKLRKETAETTIISDIPEDGPPLPFLKKPDDADKEVIEHDPQVNGDKAAITTDSDQKDTSLAPDDTVEYEEEMVIVTYGSFVNIPTKTDKLTILEHVLDSTDAITDHKPPESTDTTVDKPPESTDTTVDKPPESTDTTVDKPPESTDTTVDKPPESTDTTVDKPPESTDTTVDKPPESTDTTVDKPPESTDTTVDKPFKRTDATMDIKPSNSTATTAGHKPSESTNMTMQGPATTEISTEQNSSLLVSLRPYLISQSDINCCMSPTGTKKGAFGTIVTIKWFSTDCSLQEFNLDFSGENKMKYKQYLTVCAMLTKLRHPNIQQLLGFVSEDDTKPSASIVAELVDLTLTKLLADRKPDDLEASTHISIAYDVAKGVSYLHSLKMTHLLIRSDCVLVTKGYLAKLCDIAESQLYQQGIISLSEPVNANYLPPDTTCSSACDTFSIGVLILQIITHTAPNPTPVDEKFLTEIKRRQSQIDLVHSSHPLLILILNCIANKPDDRPTDKEICSFFETALKSQD